MRIPRSWRCNVHGLPVEFGCIYCDAIAAILRTVTGPRAGLAAEVVLMYRAHDLLHAVEGTSEFTRARRQFAHAAKVLVAHVDHVAKLTVPRLRRVA